MLKHLTIFALVFVATSLVGFFASGAWKNPPYVRCESVVDQQLDRLNVDRADIEKLFYTKQYRDVRGDVRVVGTDAWVRFHSCKGYLVIDLDSFAAYDKSTRVVSVRYLEYNILRNCPVGKPCLHSFWFWRVLVLDSPSWPRGGSSSTEVLEPAD